MQTYAACYFFKFHIDGGIPTSKSHISSSPHNCKLQKDCRINSDTLGMVLHCSHMFFVILVPCHGKARKSRLRFVLSARRNRLCVAKRHKLPRLWRHLCCQKETAVWEMVSALNSQHRLAM